ncbi:hypothetical protein V7597_16145 [Bacillus toyonensis]|uniref:hypothetical protein n=1 Tax=Bacillus toyonensis TaxID=155322 RepID=UPI002FFD720F
MESVIEHGRVIELGKSYGVDLRINKRQMDKLENRLVNESRFLDIQIEAIFYADMTIRCSNQKWWNKMQKVYEEKLPRASKIGKRILNEVAKFQGCKNASDATSCHRILVNDLKIRNVQYVNKM